MKKALSLLLAAVLLLAAAGCSAGPAPSTAGTATPDSSSTSTTPAAEPVTLKLGLPNGDTLTPASILESFKKAYPHYTVEVDEAPWADFKTKLQTQIASGNPPDVFFTDSGFTASIGAKGAALDLKPFIDRDLNADDYSAALFAAQDAEGRVWGIPHAVQGIAIAYNKTLFDQANVPYPTDDWTYQDMFDIAQKLTTKDNYGLLTDVRITQGWLPYILSTGGAPLDETRTKAMFSDPKTVEGVKKWYDSIHTLGITPPRSWLESFGGYAQAFAMGRGAMLVMQAGNATTINTTAPDLNYDIVMMPKGWDGQRHVVTVANNWIIFSRSDAKVQEAAWDWIEHYLGEQAQADYAAVCPAGYPIRKSALELVANADFKPANKAAFIDGMDLYSVTLFENSSWQEWTTETNKVMLDMYDGKISAEDACNQLQATVQKILDANP